MVPMIAPCPTCGGSSFVVETRQASYGTRRMRGCHACRIRWGTVEIDVAILGQLVEFSEKVIPVLRTIAAIDLTMLEELPKDLVDGTRRIRIRLRDGNIRPEPGSAEEEST